MQKPFHPSKIQERFAVDIIVTGVRNVPKSSLETRHAREYAALRVVILEGFPGDDRSGIEAELITG